MFQIQGEIAQSQLIAGIFDVNLIDKSSVTADWVQPVSKIS
jgi:hypothetical protein